MEKTSYNWYKLSDDNVIGGNSNRCLKTRGELNNLSQSNLKDWMLYCPSLRAHHCGIWYLVTIYVDDLPHCIKKRKNELWTK